MSCESCLLGILGFAGCASSKRAVPHKIPEPKAIDIGLLRAWRHRALGSLLPSSDEGLLLDIAKFLEDPSPPALATISFSSGITMGLSRDSLRLPQSSHMMAVAVDSGGMMVLAGIKDPGDLILVWDFEAVGSLQSHIRPKMLSRSMICARPTSLWINTIANRLAVGSADGTVQIWNLDTGVLRATCFAQILESTRWTTVGHTGEISVIRDAPLAKHDNGLEYVRAGDACVATGDKQGVVCLWTDDGHPVSTMYISFFASRLGLTDHVVADLASAPGLLICALSRAVIGLEAPGHAAIFLLSLECHSPNAAYLAGDLLGIAYLPSDSSRHSIVGFTADGSSLSWDIEDSGARYTQYDFCFPSAVQASLLASACSHVDGPTITVSCRSNLCWLLSKQSGKMDIRWVGNDKQKPLVYQGCVNQNAPIDSAVLLPKKLKIPNHKRVIVLPATCL